MPEEMSAQDVSREIAGHASGGQTLDRRGGPAVG
jgi:hypothetical protein